MTAAVVLSWWLLPLAITIILYSWAIWASTNQGGGGDYAMIGQAVAFVAFMSIATIGSLVSWLIWALAA